MNKPPDNFIKLFRKHHLLSLATYDGNSPWCCSCFYAYLQSENFFVVTSDINTKHIQNLNHSINVAGTIALETKIIGKIRGVQFTGIMKKLDGEELKTAKKAYLKRFPIASLMKTTLWAIYPDMLKLTDNRLGFGKKIIWNSSDEN
ncbi:MAG: hypothetical protein R6U11_10315 [Bacteroidales bacterium]